MMPKCRSLEGLEADLLAIVLATVVALGQSSASFAPVPRAAITPLSTAEVVQKMVAMNAVRTQALHAYTATRRYHVVYDGLEHESADMQVYVAYQQPGPKRFTVVSETGSGMLRHHVLEPLLRAERNEASIDSSAGSAIAPENYSFEMLDFPHSGAQDDYVLTATPRATPRFLFHGTIWVNPADSGIERVDGQLLHSPSWWITRTDFSYRSQKIGDFWLPASNHCVSHIRFFGHAVLDITYQDFELTSISSVGPQAVGAGR